jgi:hypothetical protein
MERLLDEHLLHPSIDAVTHALKWLMCVWPDGFLYQRDGEIIAFARPDLAASGMSSSSAEPAAYS